MVTVACGLPATSHEIIYVSPAATVVLVMVALQMGFSAPDRPS